MKKRNENPPRVKTISYVMLITLLGKLMALLRDRMLAQSYGVSLEASAFFVASQLPRVFFDAVFASAVTMSFIPIFSQCMQQGGKKKAFEFSNIFITFVGFLMLILSVLGMIFSDGIAALMAPQFSAEGQKLTSDLLRILFPTLIFTGITFSFIGILQSLENFLIPAWTSVVFNSIIIVYFFGPDAKWRIYGLAFIYLIGWVMQAAMQIPSLHRQGYRFRPDFRWNNGYLKQVGVMILPVMISTWVQPLYIVVNIWFASGISESAVAVINFANNIYTIIIAVFILSIMNVIFPKMSDMVNQGESEELERLTGQTLGTSLFFVIPMMIGLMSLSQEVIALIYAGKEFDQNSVFLTGEALYYFAPGMIGYTLQAILSRVYFARRQGKVPMLGALIAIVSNIILSFGLVKTMGMNGLAMASSLSAALYGLILLIPMLKSGHQVFDLKMGIDLLKMTIAAALMGFNIDWLKNRLGQAESLIGQIMQLGGFVALGIFCYLIIALILQVNELKNIRAFINKKR